MVHGKKRDSNLDCWVPRQPCWPLDYYHGPRKSSFYASLETIEKHRWAETPACQPQFPEFESAYWLFSSCQQQVSHSELSSIKKLDNAKYDKRVLCSSGDLAEWRLNKRVVWYHKCQFIYDCNIIRKFNIGVFFCSPPILTLESTFRRPPNLFCIYHLGMTWRIKYCSDDGILRCVMRFACQG